MKKTINITEEELGLIEKYLSKQLSGVDKLTFDQNAANDILWQDKINEVQLLTLGIQEAALTEKLHEFHQAIPNTKTGTKVVKINWIKRLAIAATMILGVTTLSWLLFFRQSSDERLFAGYYQPDPGLATVMGVSENYEFEKAMVDYKLGNYTKAIETWKKLETGNADNDTLTYFIGSAFLANKDPQNALPYFDKVLQHSNATFSQEALWYKSLALLQLGKKNEAITTLKNIDHPQKSSLLDKLKE